MSNGTPPGAIPHGTSPPTTARSFRQSLFAMLGLSSVVMMVAIDQTVVGTALPTIVAELKGFNLYAWVATAYLLASVITVPIFGRLGDWFGRKPLIVIAIVVFTAASVLCGAAHSMQALVLFRALQGIGGGMLVGTCFASIPDLFPDPVVRLRWQVLFSSAFGVANAVGPSLGGFLSEHYGWRSAFFVNLPVGVLSLYLTARHLPNIRHQLRGKLSPDWRGALLIAAGLGALQLLVESLAQQTLKVSTIAFGVVALSAGALLMREELRAADPILPPALLRERAIIALLALSMLMGLAMFALLFYVPLLLQGGMGLNADRAGVMVTPLVLCITVGTIANTRVVTRLRKPNLLLYVGFALLGVACWGVAAERMETSHALMAALTAGGVGIGLVMPNLTVFAQQVAGKRQLGIATAMIQSARMVGGMIGTAVVGTIVHVLYRQRVADVLQGHGIDTDAPWVAPAAHSPQLLLTSRDVATFIRDAHAAGFDGDALIAAARVALVQAIDHALLAVSAAMVLACLAVSLVPLIRVQRLGREVASVAVSE
ncbi:MFS transporter [Paraburkholderia sp. 40]|uniref:MFS transporter n=1 Tax=Paraburkholderia sp. 40 TaxID=2991059 RepID=UPI003D21B9B4